MEYKKHLQQVLEEDCYPVESLICQLSLIESLVDRIIFLKQFITDMNLGIIKMLIDNRLNERPPAYLKPYNKKGYDLARLWNEHIEDFYEKLKQFAENRAPLLIKEYTSIIKERVRLENMQAERAAVINLETDEVLDYFGVKTLLGVSMKTVYHYKYKGFITPIPSEGTKPRFRKADILAFKHGLT